MSRRADGHDNNQLTVRRQLGQVRPPSANTPVEIYAPAFNVSAVIVLISVVNDSNQDITLTAYHDKDGTTYNIDTRVAQRIVRKGDESAKEGLLVAMDGQGSFAVETSSAGDLTFTIWGTERPRA